MQLSYPFSNSGYSRKLLLRTTLAVRNKWINNICCLSTLCLLVIQALPTSSQTKNHIKKTNDYERQSAVRRATKYTFPFFLNDQKKHILGRKINPKRLQTYVQVNTTTPQDRRS